MREGDRLGLMAPGLTTVAELRWERPTLSGEAAAQQVARHLCDVMPYGAQAGADGPWADQYDRVEM